jgi:hypothetical protein
VAFVFSGQIPRFYISTAMKIHFMVFRAVWPLIMWKDNNNSENNIAPNFNVN